jgi:hypothetical protein
MRKRMFRFEAEGYEPVAFASTWLEIEAVEEM